LKNYCTTWIAHWLIVLEELGEIELAKVVGFFHPDYTCQRLYSTLGNGN